MSRCCRSRPRNTQWQNCITTTFLTPLCIDLDTAGGLPLVGVHGRYIEARVALTRDDPTKQPILYEIRLYGTSPF